MSSPFSYNRRYSYSWIEAHLLLMMTGVMKTGRWHCAWDRMTPLIMKLIACWLKIKVVSLSYLIDLILHYCLPRDVSVYISILDQVKSGLWNKMQFGSSYYSWCCWAVSEHGSWTAFWCSYTRMWFSTLTVYLAYVDCQWAFKLQHRLNVAENKSSNPV